MSLYAKLQQRASDGKPITVGLIGAGKFGSMYLAQIPRMYVEAEEDGVHVFVRDRGVGFDPDGVPDDRHGLADSVHAALPGTAVPSGCAAPPAKAPRCTSRYPAHPPGGPVDQRAGSASSSSTTTPSSGSGARRARSQRPDVTVIGEAARWTRRSRRSGTSSRTWCSSTSHMPDGGGAEVLAPGAPGPADVVFLALSVSDAAEDVIAVIRPGARGYVTKTISGRELGRRRASGAFGRPGVLPAAGRLRARRASPTAPAPPPSGTPSWICSPAASATSCACWPAATPYKEIAAELFISVKTVETHVSSVLRKTQLSNRYELSRWASDRRLV